MKEIFVYLLLTAFTAYSDYDASTATTQQVQVTTAQTTLVQLPSQPQSESSEFFSTTAEWHSHIMNDVAVTYEMARQIAIDYADISQPDVANLRSIMNRNSDNPIWNFAVAGAGLMVSIQIDSATGEIVRSQQFRGGWPAESLPISFDEAVRIAINHANISSPFITYFHGHTTLPNGNQFWRVHIDSHYGVYDIHVDAFTGEVIYFRN
ncbi:MAG: PepSY domain-containing protein [Defluviitaleaceae bacterium]|nr:PepSY domain-containing protein [Defluviitaleaceae bacterium]